jgi:hypothetical protein
MLDIISFSSFVALQEGVVNPAMLGDKDIQKLDKMLKNPRASEIEKRDSLASIHAKYLPLITSVMNKFQSQVKREMGNLPKVKFLAGTKPFESLISKVISRGKKISEINDLVRGAVLFDTKEQADAFVKNFTRRNSSNVVEYEVKDKGSDTTYGYFGSHHIGLNIDGIIVELQVMTRKLWNYKGSAHVIYNNTREKKGGPNKFDISQSKKIFALGNRPGYVKDDWDLSELEVILETNDEAPFRY